MQISGNISGNSVSLSSSDQQITSVTTPAIVGAGSTLTVTVSTVGYNPGDTVYWSATGTTINSTGSGVVSNSLGIIGSASLAVPISSYDTGTVRVFLLKSQASSIVSQTAGPVSINQYYGWFAGGSPGTPAVAVSSTIARIDFSNDNVTPSIRGPLPQGRTGMSSTGNANYGWFGWGGAPSLKSDFLRIDWANDSPTAPSPRASGANTSYGNSSAGNANYGWFAFGTNPASPTAPYGSRVDRLDYANDTNTTSPRGAMSQSRSLVSGVGTANYGWFGGGYLLSPTPGAYSTANRLDKIDYANDTATATFPSTIGAQRRATGATGNANYGWFGGGFDAGQSTSPGGGVYVSSINRIDWSNGTGSTRGSMSISRDSYGATGNAGYGYFVNGYPNTSIVDRIDYSNDAVTAISRSAMAESKSSVSGTSSYEGTF